MAPTRRDLLTGAGGLVALLGLAKSAKASACDEESDLPASDGRLAINRLRVTKIVPSWKDIATGTTVQKEPVSNAYPIAEADPSLRITNFNRQSMMNPCARLVGNGEWLLSGYGNITRPSGDTSRGDSTMIMRMFLHDGQFSFQRRQAPVLAFPQDPDNYWPNQGGLGTGMSFLSLPPNRYGLRYFGVVGMHQGPFSEDGAPAGRDILAQSVSADGINWRVIKEGTGWPPTTTDVALAKPFIAYSRDVPFRNYHEAMYYSDPARGGDGKVYLLFGQSTAQGIVTYLMRYSYDPARFSGISQPELWSNGQDGYSPDGSWVAFGNRTLDDYMMDHGTEYRYLWDMVEPTDTAPIYGPDGQDGVLLLYQSQKGFGAPKLDYRVSATNSWPFLWGPRRTIDLSELFAAGYTAGTAGGLSASVLQHGARLYLLVSTAPGAYAAASVTEGQPRFLGLTHTTGGLKICQLYANGPDDPEMLPTLPSWR